MGINNTRWAGVASAGSCSCRADASLLWPLGRMRLTLLSEDSTRNYAPASYSITHSGRLPTTDDRRRRSKLAGEQTKTKENGNRRDSALRWKADRASSKAWYKLASCVKVGYVYSLPSNEAGFPDVTHHCSSLLVSASSKCSIFFACLRCVMSD